MTAALVLLGGPLLLGVELDDTAQKDLSRWISKMQDRNQRMTLEDFAYFEGGGEMTEMRLVDRECRRRGWAVAEESCRAFIEDRESNPAQSESYFLEKIRRRLGKGRAEVVGYLKRHRAPDDMAYDLIELRWGPKRVILFRTMTGSALGQFGHLSIHSIDGVSASDVVEAELGETDSQAAPEKSTSSSVQPGRGPHSVWWHKPEIAFDMIVGLIAAREIASAQPYQERTRRIDEALERAALLFDGDRSEDSLQWLVRLAYLDLGTAPGEVFSCVVLRQGELVLQRLRAELADRKDFCVEKLAKATSLCVSTKDPEAPWHRMEALISQIEKDATCTVEP